MKIIEFLTIIIILFFVQNELLSQAGNDYNYTGYSRLTDPLDNEFMLKSLPDNFEQMCNIANLQSVHHTMLSQWKIPVTEWKKIARANHDIKDILDTLKAKGDGKLSINRKLEDRIFGACTKESIFSTSMLRAKGIPARIRVGYLTNLYTGEKAIEFWRNVNKYAMENPHDSAEFDQYSYYMKEINKSIEHWVTEYWDDKLNIWRILDIRPEYLQAYGFDVGYHLPDEYFEYGYEAWLKINSPNFKDDSYSEQGMDGKTDIRYQMLMDFYSLLNHDVPGIFDSEGRIITEDNYNEEIKFLKKKYSDHTSVEINELDELAQLLIKQPSVDELLKFYYKSNTLKIKSIEVDPYSFVFQENQKNSDNK